MRRLVSIDGKVASPDRALVSAYDRGFLYGDAVFETLRSYGGVPCELPLHLERLERSAALVRMDLPWTRAELSSRVLEVFAAARESPADDGYVRVVVSRGEAPLGLDLDLAAMPRLVIYAEPLPKTPPFDAGIAVRLATSERATSGTPAAGAKVTSYLASILALGDAKAAGAQEVLFVGPDGRLVEGATSNVFVVTNGDIRTPPEDTGLLAGITRRLVMEVAPVREAPVFREELFAADEVFVTSSLREVLGVVAIDGKAVGGGRVGEWTKRTHAAYRARVGATRA